MSLREEMRDCLADESVEQRKARLQQMREQMRDSLADELAEQRGQATAHERADEGPPG